MRALLKSMRWMLGAEKGATAVEYGLILALIVLAIMAALLALGTTTSDMWNNVSTKVQTASPGN